MTVTPRQIIIFTAWVMAGSIIGNLIGQWLGRLLGAEL